MLYSQISRFQDLQLSRHSRQRLRRHSAGDCSLRLLRLPRHQSHRDLTLEELQDRLRGSVERLARYNRERFGRSCGRQRAADVPDPARDRTGAFPPSGDETSGTDDRKYDQRGGDRGRVERGCGHF